MKLITATIEKTFAKYPLYSQDSKGDEAVILAKYFFGAYTWYVLEAQKEDDGDYTFFGLVDVNGEKEYGYFTLGQLKEIKMWGYPCVERDLYFDKTAVKNVA